MSLFDGVKKNFGFGCMRLPLLENGEVDHHQFSEMIDKFIEHGFNYFDTAKGYLGGKSEVALRECLVKRYSRDKFLFANKLSFNFFEKQEDIRPLFEKQLESCGLEYFDAYLMHAQNARSYKKYTDCRAYETAYELKKEGKIKHLGMSFHDKDDVLDMILSDHPELEFVQIQFNYSDYDDEGVQSKRCYDVCRKHGKPMIVMEPVRGGSLINLPDEAQKVFDSLNGGSNASYAIRYCASFEGIEMVLSGMSNIEQMADNLSYMTNFIPLSKEEWDAVSKVQSILKKQNLIPCTACRYCVDGCPKKIPIPEIFACMNKKMQYKNWNSDWYYEICTDEKGKASECISCGKCEKACPQNLEIKNLLKLASAEFER